MDIDVFSEMELPTVLRVLRTALSPDLPLSSIERSFLQAYARIAGCDLAPSDPPPLHAREVQVEGAHRRKRLVQLASLAVLLGRPVKPGSFAFVQELSRHLAADDPVIAVIDALRKGRHLRVRVIALRRAMRVMFKEAWAAEGAVGMVRLFGALWLKAAVNKDRLWTYKRLGLLPEGTLGREYWRHMTTQGFGFPGDVAGVAASVAYHDIAHVLTGHDVTAQGEIQQGSFQGGNRREDGFFFIQFVVLQFHHGIRITPASPPATGHFDPDTLLWAIHRGARCSVDLTHQWDYWPLMALPLAEARARCGLLERSPVRAGVRRVA